jgi:hypothetical protein
MKMSAIHEMVQHLRMGGYVGTLTGGGSGGGGSAGSPTVDLQGSAANQAGNSYGGNSIAKAAGQPSSGQIYTHGKDSASNYVGTRDPVLNNHNGQLQKWGTHNMDGSSSSGGGAGGGVPTPDVSGLLPPKTPGLKGYANPTMMTNTVPSLPTDVNGQNGFRQGQIDLAHTLSNQANGIGPSIAALQLQQGQNANMAQQFALANSAHGANQAGALRNAANNAGMISGNMAQQSAMARLAEQQQAAGALGNVLQAGHGQDIQMSGIQSNADIANQGAYGKLQQQIMDQTTNTNNNAVQMYGIKNGLYGNMASALGTAAAGFAPLLKPAAETAAEVAKTPGQPGTTGETQVNDDGSYQPSADAGTEYQGAGNDVPGGQMGLTGSGQNSSLAQYYQMQQLQRQRQGMQ